MNRPSKKIRTIHNEEKIKEALERIKSRTISIRQASKIFGIPTTTLHDKLNGKSPIVVTANTLLTVEEESQLAKWLLELAQSGSGKTNKQIRETARAICQKRSTEVVKEPGYKWLSGFYRRHPHLSPKTPEKEKADITPQAILEWFSEFKNCVDKIDSTLFNSPERIFTVGETGFYFDINSRTFVACKGAKPVYKVSNTKNKVTVLACTSASGQYIQPLLIYPCKRIPSKNMLREFPEAVLQVSDNGWLNATIFHCWIRDCFVPLVKDLSKPVLLLVDGHTSQTCLLATSQLCEENSIYLYCLLADASHLIQPLDQAFFSVVHTAWEDATLEHISVTGEGVNLKNFAKVLKPVWLKAATCKNAFTCFSSAGIYPFNPDNVLQSGKLGSSQVSAPTPTGDTHIADCPTSSTAICHPSISTLETKDSFFFSVPPDSPLPFWSLSPSNLNNLTLYPTHESQDSSISSQLKEPTASSNAPIACHSTSSSAVCHPSISTHEVQDPSVSSVPPDSTLPTCSHPPPGKSPLNVKQLKALKKICFFARDNVTRNQLVRFFRRLGSDPASAFPDQLDETCFQKFETLTAEMQKVFKLEPQPAPRAKVAADIYKLPSCKGKAKTKNVPIMASLVSGDELQTLLQKKLNAKDKKEKLLAKQLIREERKKEKEVRLIAKEMKKHEREWKKEKLQHKKVGGKKKALHKHINKLNESEEDMDLKPAFDNDLMSLDDQDVGDAQRQMVEIYRLGAKAGGTHVLQVRKI